MNLKGKQTYQASAQQIWDILMDTEKLTKITPGVSRLEQTSEDHFDAISEVKIGPVKGSFKGDLVLSDKVEPEGFTLNVKQKSKIGNADAAVHIKINDLGDGQSELSFNGKAKLSGTLARTGQRVLSGVASSLTKQFFKGLEKELQAIPVAEVAAPAPERPRPSVAAPLVEERSKEPQGFFATWLAWIKGLFGG